MDVIVDGSLIHVDAGELFCVDSHALHQVIATADCCQYVCVFDKRLLEFALADYVSWTYIVPYIENRTTIVGPVEDAEGSIRSAFETIMRDCRERSTCFQLDVKLHLLKVFALLIKTGHVVERMQRTHGLEPIACVLGYIEEHFAEEVSAAQLASLVGYNPQYFSRSFKRACGMSPTEYVNRFRIERACDRLLDSDQSILDIAVACGFSSASYFIKKFKEYKSITPRRYREMLMDNRDNWSEYYSTIEPAL